ncbi:MAG: 3-phosphoshikimate 1-carboxyvinyltransferase [Oscillospiraceae bacterium]|nr:3-phosphoshikimate 1-carboxyvinyltransferase [Oscillospiraceae bacterium]
MDITIQPAPLRGEVTAIPSKSQAHRLLICATFADQNTDLLCPQTNRDIEATADCLRALGAKIEHTAAGYTVEPIKAVANTATLDCCESGSTLRFMLPIVCALGVDATFKMAGRLPQRPLSPLWEELERMQCTLTRPTEDTIHCTGKLKPGKYTIDGSVSSQFITGLLFAQALIKGETELEITGKVESRPYIEMTRRALALFGSPNFKSPGTVIVEGDWSNGAFFLAAKALGCNLSVLGLDNTSAQGDRAVAEILEKLCNGIAIVSAADIPDLVPILAVVAAAKHGATFTDIRRLRLKESDRVASVIDMITALGGEATADENSLYVRGTSLRGGTVNSCNDHRIAMAAAIAATVCSEPVTILGADAVNKSYPQFWDEYRRLGGKYEQYLR